MTVPVYVGDEVSACGYRLAGMRVVVPRPYKFTDAVEAACQGATLVFVSAAIARQLPRETLERLLAGIEPQVVVVPDVRGRAPFGDPGERMRQQLGVLE